MRSRTPKKNGVRLREPEVKQGRRSTGICFSPDLSLPLPDYLFENTLLRTQAEPPQPGKGMDLTWAFPITDTALPPPRGDGDGVVRQVRGSPKTYTQAQIDDLFNPPDWFPDEHAPMLAVVQHGSGTAVPGCASCHLALGLGHPESANLTGLSAEYKWSAGKVDVRFRLHIR